jgi:hypothetical protein
MIRMRSSRWPRITVPGVSGRCTTLRRPRGSVARWLMCGHRRHRRSLSTNWCRGGAVGVGTSMPPPLLMCPARWWNPGAEVARPAGGVPHEDGVPEPAATEPVTESGAALTATAPIGTPGAPDPVVALVLRPGSPVRIGPQSTALAALLTCGHYLPIGRAASVLEALAGIWVSTGFLAGVRGRAATLLETAFLPHLRALLPTAGVLHADETTGRAAGELAYVHVACTEYLTLMHVGGRTSEDIDAGGVLPRFTGTLLRDGYAGYAHLPAVHAWCAAHLLRDLRALSDADPAGQLWAQAMATTLLEANQAAHHARATGAETLDQEILTQIRNHYLGALAKGRTDNHDHRSASPPRPADSSDDSPATKT